MGSLTMGDLIGGTNWYLQRARRSHASTSHQIVWVDRAYNPTDLRANIPVPRHKPLVSSDVGKATKAELLPHIQKNHGCIVSSPYVSTVATRSEDSNTLTHMLPTTGIPYKCRPPNWGTAQGGPPKLHNTRKPKGYHKFSSPMTRYVDQMHHTNKLFKLH